MQLTLIDMTSPHILKRYWSILRFNVKLHNILAEFIGMNEHNNLKRWSIIRDTYLIKTH